MTNEILLCQIISHFNPKINKLKKKSVHQCSKSVAKQSLSNNQKLVDKYED